jgi:NAD-dependent DNA ligase
MMKKENWRKMIELEKMQSFYDLVGTSFVFTGVRRADLEEVIESRGGKIGSSVSKTQRNQIQKNT